MKRLVSRITLVALIAATCTPMTYSINKSAFPFAVSGIACAIAGIARLWYLSKQDQTQYKADCAEYNAINNDLPVLETEKEQKPAFCKLQGQERAARKAYYAQEHCQGKADREEVDHATLGLMIATKKDRQAALHQAITRSNEAYQAASFTLIYGTLFMCFGAISYLNPTTLR